MLSVDETLEWCNSLIILAKVNGKVMLCIDPVHLNEALIRPIHRGSTLNDILPKLTGVKYLTLIDTTSWYHNLKLNEKSYSTTFSCPLGRYQYIRLPFGAAPVSDMFHKKIDKLSNDISYVFGIADDIVIAGFDADGRDHDASLKQVLQRCKQVNLKLNKEKCLFRWTCIPFLVRWLSGMGWAQIWWRLRHSLICHNPKQKDNCSCYLVQ